ncbi:Ig-like domain-containing protein [Vibrio rotiferianus]|uniref:Ig-like domain-containing protein n=1 Tax=Vibrio rotiferianus TaxID=190895 RepID=UPI00390997A8
MKSVKTMFKWMLAIATALSLTACGGDDGGSFLDDNGTPSGSSIELLVNGAKDDVSLSLGQQAPIKVRFHGQSDQALYVDLDKVSFEHQGEAIRIDSQAGVLVGQAETAAPISLVAKYQGMTSNAVMVSVSPASLSELQLTPESMTLAAGQRAELSVSAMYSNGLQTQLTPEAVTWEVANEEVVRLDNGTLTASSVGEATVTATYGGLTAQAQVVVSDATLDAIHLALLPDLDLLAPLSTVPIGTSEALAVVGVFSDGRTQTLSAVTYHIDGDSVTQKDNVFTSVKAGLSSITADYVEPSTGNTLVTPAAVISVTSAEIKEGGVSITTLEMVRHSMTVDVPLQLSAQAVWEDGSVFDVTSAAEWKIIEGQDVFELKDNGVVVGLKAGTGTVQATLNGEVARATLEVSDPDLSSLSIDPANAVVSVGLTQAFVVTGHYSNNTDVVLSPEQLSFTVEESDIATIVDGVLTGRRDGTTTVKVVSKTDLSKVATASVTVVDKAVKSVEVTLSASNIAVGADTKAQAVVMYDDNTTEVLAQNINWHSSRSDVALITDGDIRGLAEGTTDIRATYRGVTSTPVALSVSGKTVESIYLLPSTLNLVEGQEGWLRVMAVYSDKTVTEVPSVNAVWKVPADKSDIVSVDVGQIKGLKKGRVDVTAEYAGKSATVTVTVSDATLSSIMLALKSDHTVLPSSYEAPIGMTVETVVLGLYSNGDSSVLSPVTYHLNGESVERSGDVFTTVASGLSTATASYADPATGKEWTTPAVNVFVTGSTLELDGLTITTPEAERHNMIKGVALPLTVMAQWDDGTSFNVSSAADWVVINGDDVAQVSGVGVVTGKKAGEATVQATFSGKSVTTTVKVSAPALTSLSITPETAAVSVGQTQTLVVMGHYANDTIVPLSANQFSLSVGDAEVASIEDGVLTAKQGGSTTVTATFNDDTSQRATASITVIDKAVKSVSVTLEASTIAVGGSTQARALVTYVDDSTETVTNNVAWHTSEPEVALVTNGYVRALKASDSAVGISATYRGKTSTPAMLQVSGKTVERIQFTPSTLTLRDGQEADLNSYLMLVYSDKTVAPLSDFTQVTWKLDPADSNVVSLDRGKVTAQNQGDVTVVAEYPGVPKAEMSIKVSPAALEGVVLALKSDPTFLLPRSYPAPIEFSTQLAVVGVYTDGTRVLSPGEYVYDITGDAVTHKGDEFTTVKGGVSSITARYVGTETEETLVTPAVEVLVSNATIKEGGLSIVGPDTLVKGLPVKLTAQAIWDDGSVFNITAAVTWAVTQGQANVSLDETAPGWVTGNVPGTKATITATYGGQEASIELTVSEAKLEAWSVNPEYVVLPTEQTQALVFTGHYDNETTQTLAASQFTFNVDDTNVGSISKEGVFTAKEAGSTFVTVTYDDDTLSGDVTKPVDVPVTVTNKKVDDVKLSLSHSTIAVGATASASVEVKFEGDETYTPITEGISWQSSKPEVAFVMGSQVRGDSAGDTDITASYQGVPSNSEKLIVSGKTIDNLYFVPSSLSLPAGHQVTLKVMAVYSDKSVDELSNNNITWGLPDNKGIVSSITEYGVLTASKTNTGSETERVTAKVSGSSSSSPTAEMTVTVNSATLESMALARKGGNLLPQGIEMQIGTVLSLEAKGFYSNEETHTLTPITYQLIKDSASADASLVSTSDGEYEAVRPGLSTIKATYLDTTTGKPFDATVSVSVSAAALDKVEITTPESDRHGMVVNVPLQLSVQAVWNDEDSTTYDITSAATWTVVEDKNGLFTGHSASNPVFVAKGAGQATVRANFQGKPSADVTLKVANATLSSYSLSPEVSVVKVGQSQTFVAKAHYSNETDATLSDNYDLKATINGKTITADASTPDTLTFTEEGNAVVTLMVGGTSVATANVTVVNKKVASVRVKLKDTTIETGGTTTATAYVTYEDNTSDEVEVSDGVVWGSSDKTVALVTEGSVKGLKASSTAVSITAKYGDETGTAQLTVADRTVSALEATPTNIEFDVGQSKSITVKATFSDGDKQIIDGADVKWDVTTGASLIDVTGGEVTTKSGITSIGSGTATVTATYGGKSATVGVKVNNPLTSLRLTPTSSQLHQHMTQQFTLQAHYSVGAPKDVTEDALWKITGTAGIATVGNTSGNKGKVTGVAEGSTVVSAEWGDEPDVTATIYVLKRKLERIEIVAADQVLAGAEEPISVLAYYQGESVPEDVTSKTAFDGDRSVLIVQQGVMLGRKVGKVSISATFDNESDVKEVEVVNYKISAIPPIVVSEQVSLQMTTVKNGAIVDVTEQTIWTSKDASVATFLSNDNLLTGKSIGEVVIEGYVDSKTYTTKVKVLNDPVIDIKLALVESVVDLNDRVDVTVEGTTANGKTIDVTHAIHNLKGYDNTILNWRGVNFGIFGVKGGVSDFYVTYENSLGVELDSNSVTVTIRELSLSKSGDWYGVNSYLEKGTGKPEAQVICSVCSHSNFTFTWRVDMDGDGDFYGGKDREYVNKSYAPDKEEFGKAVQLTAEHDDLASAIINEYTNDSIVMQTFVNAKGGIAFLKDDGSVSLGGSKDWGNNLSSWVIAQNLNDVKSVYSNDSSFAVLKNDGRVYGWSGDSSFSYGDIPADKQALLVDVKDIYTNSSSYAALTDLGAVIAWGYSSYLPTPAEETELVSGVEEVIPLSRNMVALKTNGNIVQWGLNDIPSALKANLYGISKVLKVSDDGVAFIRDSDNTLYYWKQNLGEHVELALVGQVKQVFATPSTSCAYGGCGGIVILYEDGSISDTYKLETIYGDIAGDIAYTTSVISGDVSDVTHDNSRLFSALTDDGDAYVWGGTSNRSATTLTNFGTNATNVGTASSLAWAYNENGGAVEFFTRALISRPVLTDVKDLIYATSTDRKLIISALHLDGTVTVYSPSDHVYASDVSELYDIEGIYRVGNYIWGVRGNEAIDIRLTPRKTTLGNNLLRVEAISNLLVGYDLNGNVYRAYSMDPIYSSTREVETTVQKPN